MPWWPRLCIAVAIALASVALLGRRLPPGAAMTRGSYDLSLRLSAPWNPVISTGEVVIVYIDVVSHDELGQSPIQPWDRRLHADLVRRLTAAGARAIVFDIIFDTEWANAAVDDEFAAAMRDSKRVILGAEVAGSGHQPADREGTRSRTLKLPIPKFVTASAGEGLANLLSDDDFTVRERFDGFPDQNLRSLAESTARFARPAGAADTAERRWLRYYGPTLTIPSVSYHTALAPKGVPDAMFRDRVVLIGARPQTGMFEDRRDEFRSPFPNTGSTEAFMPGVEVHATHVLNLLRNDGLRRLPWGAEVAIVFLGAIVFGFAITWVRTVVAGMACGLGLIVVLVLVPVGVVTADVWFPWMIVAAFQIPAGMLHAVVLEQVVGFRERRWLDHLRRKAEAQNREKAALLDKARDAILVQELGGAISYANPGAAQLYGWDVATLLENGLPPTALAASEAQRSAARETALARGEWQGELEQLTRTGAVVHVQSRWTLIKDPGGRPKSLLIINSDITEKKRIEAQYLRAQRLEAVGALAGGMAHDLNNALSPVVLGVQMLRQRPIDDETASILEAMETNATRGTEMVRQVLAFARGQDGGSELVNVRLVLRELERMLRQTFPRGIRVDSLVSDDVWSVRANATRIHQVLLNLCLNARDAMPQGGVLTLAADNVELGATEAAEIPGCTPGAYVVLTVSDTGTGISQELLERIFEPFFTTKPAGKGTGLGLATVNHIVRSLGGVIHVQSQPGSGTTFEVYLPRVEPGTQDTVLLVAAGRGTCVLVIDDEHAMRQLLAATVDACGHRAITAPDATEGIARFKRIDVNQMVAVVLDGNLPEGDVAAVLEHVRSLPVRIPVVRLMDAMAIARPAPGISRPVFTAPEYLITLSRPVQPNDLIQAFSAAAELRTSRLRGAPR